MKFMEVNNAMKKYLKRIVISILGLLQGFFGSYIALIGLALAFPQSSPDSKEYEEEMFVAPFGYIIMFTWLIVMIAAVLSLRKNKIDLLAFSIAWLVGLGIELIYMLVIH